MEAERCDRGCRSVQVEVRHFRSHMRKARAEHVDHLVDVIGRRDVGGRQNR